MGVEVNASGFSRWLIRGREAKYRQKIPTKNQCFFFAATEPLGVGFFDLGCFLG